MGVSVMTVGQKRRARSLQDLVPAWASYVHGLQAEQETGPAAAQVLNLEIMLKHREENPHGLIMHI